MNTENNAYKKILKLGFTIDKEFKTKETNYTSARIHNIFFKGVLVGTYTEQLNNYAGYEEEELFLIDFEESARGLIKEQEEATTHALTPSEIVEEQEETNTKEDNNMKELNKKSDEETRLQCIADSKTLEQASKEANYLANVYIRKLMSNRNVSKEILAKDEAIAVLEIKEKEAAERKDFEEHFEGAGATLNDSVNEEYQAGVVEVVKELCTYEATEARVKKAAASLDLDAIIKEAAAMPIPEYKFHVIEKPHALAPVAEQEEQEEATPHALTPSEIVEEQEESQQPTQTTAPYNGNERAAKVIKIVTGKDVNTSGMTFGDFLNMMEEEEEEAQAVEVEAVEVEAVEVEAVEVEAVEVAHTLEAQLENLKRVFTIEKKKIMASKEIAQLEDEKYQMAETAKLYVGFATNERRRKNTRGAHTCNNTARRYEDKANNIQKKIELLESDNITLL